MKATKNSLEEPILLKQFRTYQLAVEFHRQVRAEHFPHYLRDFLDVEPLHCKVNLNAEPAGGYTHTPVNFEPSERLFDSDVSI